MDIKMDIKELEDIKLSKLEDLHMLLLIIEVIFIYLFYFLYIFLYRIWLWTWLIN